MVTISEACQEGKEISTFPRLEREYQNWVNEFLDELVGSRREQVLDFVQELELNGSSKSTVQRYLRAIRTLGTSGKPYEDLSREDLIEWMREIPDSRKNGNEKLDESTINLAKRFCKRFLRYCHTGKLDLKDIEDYPEVLECIQYKQPKQSLPKDILTKEEVRKLVEVCQNQRNRAMIITLYESGCRRGEFLSLDIGDIEFDQHGAKIIVDGKTGERRIRLVESVPELQLWLNMHPHGEDRDAPVWLSRNGSKKAITGTQFGGLIKQRAKKAGIEKNVHPHLFRHSRATHLANVLTESQMREYFGWSKNSDVPSRYVHLSGRDVDGTLLEHYGIEEKDEESKDESLKPKICPRCGYENPAGSQFCNQCGMALDDETAMEIDEKREKADEIQKMFNEWFIDRREDLFKEFIQRPKVKQSLSEIREEKL